MFVGNNDKDSGKEGDSKANQVVEEVGEDITTIMAAREVTELAAIKGHISVVLHH